MPSDLYDFAEIKAAADCRTILEQQLGVPVIGRAGDWWRFAFPPWRKDSNSKGFSACRDEWRDHAKDEGGSVLDLVQRAMFPGDTAPLFRETQEYLGRLLHLTPRASVGSGRHGGRVVATYDYRDLAGNVVHQTLRYDPKEFRQRAPDGHGGWRWSLSDVTTVLYRWPEWATGDEVWIAEGEKDADSLAAAGLPGTTAAMGAEHWREQYTAALAGKRLIVLADNDAPGQKHARTIARACISRCPDVRIITPSTAPHGDVSDWIAEYAGSSPAAGLRDMAARAPKLTAGDLTDDAERVARAKDLNKTPFQNFVNQEVKDDDGKADVKRVPRRLSDLVTEVHERFLGFPRRVGTTLFDLDRDSGEIRFIASVAELFSWIGLKSGQTVTWARGEQFFGKEELYESLYSQATNYSAISETPTFPARRDVFYSHPPLPPPDPAYSYLDEFCSFFCPYADVDRWLIRALAASPMFFAPSDQTPLWIIDAMGGQGTGKSALVEKVAYLYGGKDPESRTPITVAQKQLTDARQTDVLTRRILSRSGRQKRVLMVDNVIGEFHSAELATLITEQAISGIAPYGRGEETRLNDLTFTLTTNGAELDRDLSQRAFWIWLRPPTGAGLSTWSGDLDAFVEQHRLQILADILGLLNAGPQYKAEPMSRFRLWETRVLQSVIPYEDQYAAVVKANAQRQVDRDRESAEAEQVRDRFRDGIRHAGLDPDAGCYWLLSDLAEAWTREACADKLLTGRRAIMRLRGFIRAGLMPEMSDQLKRYPAHRGQRGVMWIGGAGEIGTPSEVLEVQSDKTPTTAQKRLV